VGRAERPRGSVFHFVLRSTPPWRPANLGPMRRDGPCLASARGPPRGPS
jgi:hypothetical protein